MMGLQKELNDAAAILRRCASLPCLSFGPCSVYGAHACLVIRHCLVSHPAPARCMVHMPALSPATACLSFGPCSVYGGHSCLVTRHCLLSHPALAQCMAGPATVPSAGRYIAPAACPPWCPSRLQGRPWPSSCKLTSSARCAANLHGSDCCTVLPALQLLEQPLTGGSKSRHGRACHQSHRAPCQSQPATTSLRAPAGATRRPACCKRLAASKQPHWAHGLLLTIDKWCRSNETAISLQLSCRKQAGPSSSWSAADNHQVVQEQRDGHLAQGGLRAVPALRDARVCPGDGGLCGCQGPHDPGALA